MGGDFRQNFPVVEIGTKAEIINATINQSPLWDYCNLFHLKTNVRLLQPNLDEQKKIEIESCTMAIGDGRIKTSTHENKQEPTWIKYGKICWYLALKIEFSLLFQLCMTVLKLIVQIQNI